MKRQNCINFCIKVMLSIAVTFISCAGPSEPNSLFYKEYVIGQAPGIVRGIEIISGESLLSISWLAAERAGEYEVFISTTETLPDKP
ncbi:MAG: hypothetical protein LBG72_10335, partial [Spirochaetaceae bacterium]|nr:hypothetical protein [Spirochaetaceae bacterium]